MVRKRLKAENTDIIRTIRQEGRRFIAIMIITMLGVMMFSGLQASCNDLRKSADSFFDAQHLHDLSIQSTLGLTEDDIQALRKEKDISEAAGIYQEEVTAVYENMKMKVSFETLNDAGIDMPYITEGRMPKKEDEVLASGKFLYDSNLKIGDSFSIEEKVSEGEEPSFPITTYVIVGSCTDPCDINNPYEAVSYRSSGSSDTVFVMDDAVNHSVYTTALIRIKQVDQLFCFDDEYSEKVKKVKEQLSDQFAKKRAALRTDEVKAEGRKKIDEEKHKVDDQLADALEMLQSSQEQLNASQAQIDESQRQLNQKKEEVRSAFNEGQNEIARNAAILQDNKQKLDDASAQIQNGIVQIQSGYDQLNDKEKELSDNEAKLNDTLAQLNQQEKDLNSSLEETKQLFQMQGLVFPEEEFADCLLAYQKQDSEVIEDAKKKLEDACAQLSENTDEQTAEAIKKLPALAQGLGECEASSAQIQAGLDQITSGYAQIKAGKDQLEQKENQLHEAQSQYESGLSQWQDGQKKLEEAQNQLNAQSASAYEQMTSAWRQIQNGRKQLDEARRKLNEGRSDYEENLKKADEEITSAYDQLDEEIRPAVWYIQDRSGLNGYVNIRSDADSISAIGTVFPIIFLLVAILISLTAITRMVEEERSVTGTYKSLGYSSNAIMRKYIRFVTTACLAGIVLGTLFGFIVLPAFIFKVFDVMYLLPSYEFHWLNPQGILGPVIFLAAVNGAAIAACRNELKETPAALMRPKAPRAGKRVFLERWTFVWKRLSFLNKVTARNLFRYKRRMFMTVLGIAGCMSLLLFGFAIRDSVHDLMPRQYGKIDQYDILTVMDHSHFNEVKKSIVNNAQVQDAYPAMITSVQIQNGNQEETEQLVVLPDPSSFSKYVHLIDLNGKDIILKDDEIAITRNMAITFGLKEGDIVKGQLADLQTNDLQVTCIVQNYLSNYMFMTQSTYESLFEGFALNSMYINTSKQCTNPEQLSDQIKNLDGVLSSVSVKEMSDTFTSSFKLINAVVLIIILMSAALAFVVLYTLSTTNISERQREIATMKVLGFYDREVHSYIDKETLILTAIGIVIGIPLGRLLAETLSVVLKLPSIYLEPSLHWDSYVICSILCIVFALIVRLVTDRRLDRIDPVIALKSVE